MNEIQKKRIEVLTTFCGYGNPETAKIFFMGIEEHHTLDSHGSDSLDKLVENLIIIGNRDRKDWTYLDSSGSATGKTERTQVNVHKALIGGSLTEEEIFQSEIHCFNFYPLGANTIKQYPSHYNEYFGFETKSDLYKYFDNESRRKEILKSFINEKIINKGKMLFVFGKACWEKVENHLLAPDLRCKNPFDGWSNKKSKKPSGIKWSDNKQIWLTGHPSYGWINNEVIEKIADIRRGVTNLV